MPSGGSSGVTACPPCRPPTRRRSSTGTGSRRFGTAWNPLSTPAGTNTCVPTHQRHGDHVPSRRRRRPGVDVGAERLPAPPRRAWSSPRRASRAHRRDAVQVRLTCCHRSGTGTPSSANPLVRKNSRTVPRSSVIALVVMTSSPSIAVGVDRHRVRSGSPTPVSLFQEVGDRAAQVRAVAGRAHLLGQSGACVRREASVCIAISSRQAMVMPCRCCRTWTNWPASISESWVPVSSQAMPRPRSTRRARRRPRRSC